MNRRGFFKFLGIGAAASAVAPKFLAGTVIPKSFTGDWVELPYFGKYWEAPRAGCDYSIGVYTASALSGISCVSVMRKGEYCEPDVQVAEIAATTLDRTEFSTLVAKVATTYSRGCKDPRGPVLVIEQVTSPGDVIHSPN